ncbi:MAG: nucleotide sugar dehydrogenase, partial [Firmicutes bacterium]|nr:nucleotide sugar dehydrogenase [Bacillota bacterium]
QTVDVLVGGINDASLSHAMEVLRVINRATLHPTSIDLAETTKVIENVQRDVNIAMVQEIAKFTQAADLPTAELVRLANTHPRVNLLIPGAGVGGYCIPNAYYYLEHKATAMGLTLPILSTARRTNDDVPTALLNRIADKLGWERENWQGRKVAVLGLAMKNFSNDDRISPSVTLIAELTRRQAAVHSHDPLVPYEKYPDFGVASLEAAIHDAEVIIITIRQEQWDHMATSELLAQAPACRIIFDACEALTRSGDESVPILTM